MHLILLPFITGLGPFEQWHWLPPLQSTCAAARGEGALGGPHSHCPCFGFVEMTDQDATEKLFYNLVIDLDVESQDQIFDLGSTGEPRKNLPFCASSEGPRWTLNNNTK